LTPEEIHRRAEAHCAAVERLAYEAPPGWHRTPKDAEALKPLEQAVNVAQAGNYPAAFDRASARMAQGFRKSLCRLESREEHKRMNLGPTKDRETNIQWNHDDQTARIYTCDERMITRFRKNPVAKLVEKHLDQHGQITGMEFDVPVWAVRIARTRRTLTEGQRTALAARLRMAVSGVGRRGQSGHPGDGPE
jgi:hypothetical protein